MIVWYSTPPASRPAPRFTARSMLSLGTELFFAFWMASNSVGLPAGSPPPVRAATSMFLISLAKSLPRLASIPAFLCFVVAHLEWPLTSPPRWRSSAAFAAPLPCSPLSSQARSRSAPPVPGVHAGLLGQVTADDVDEQRVHPAVPGQFGVEAGGHQVRLADRDDPTVGRSPLDPAEDLHALPCLLHPRRPDEDRVHRTAG